MYFVSGVLFSCFLVSSSLEGDWCNTVDGVEYCENGCCDDDDEFWLEKCCFSMPVWAIILIAFGVIFLIATCTCICLKHATKGRVIQPGQGTPMQVSTVQYGYQPSGFQQHPYPTALQPPLGAGPSAPPPYPGCTQPYGGEVPSDPPPAYQSIYGQDYSSQFRAQTPAPAFPPKH